MTREGDTYVAWDQVAKQCEYCVTKLASYMKLSVRQLEGEWLTRFAMTPRSFLIECRYLEVKRSAERGVPAKVIASELGYRHVANFSRWVKRHSGSTFRELSMQAKPVKSDNRKQLSQSR